MVNGEIHYARFPITVDSNDTPIVFDIIIEITGIFPASNYDNVISKIVPISGGSGIANAVMIVFARRIT